MKSSSKNKLTRAFDRFERASFRVTDRTDRILARTRLPHLSEKRARRTRKGAFNVARWYTNLIGELI